MPKWARRLRDIADRNPDALPEWLRDPSQDKVWYRVAWQTDAGVSAEDAARPVLMMLDWLARRGKLSQLGVAELQAAQSGDHVSLALTSAMVVPKAAAFLDAHWESWWESYGINLTISAASADIALAAIDEAWAAFGKGGQA